MTTRPGTAPKAWNRVWLGAVSVAGLLVGAGLLVFPAARQDWRGTWPGLAGVFAVLVAYAVVGLWGARRLEQGEPDVLCVATCLGLVAGAIYAIEIVTEYLLLPSDNTRYGYVEFGSVFLCYVTAGCIASYQTRRIANGLKAGVGAAMISALLWYIALLATTYVMKGTSRQTAVFRAEGNFEDFARSGSKSFEAWAMQDFLGAGFYHLLLGAVVAALLGLIGGGIGRLFSRDPAKAP